MSVDDQFGGEADRIYFGARGSFPRESRRQFPRSRRQSLSLPL